MREALLRSIRQFDLGQFRVTDELPWSAAGEPLYEKNMRVFYVGEPDSTESDLLPLMCGGSALIESVTTISVFVTVDAKKRPQDLDRLTQQMRQLARIALLPTVRSQTVSVSNSLNADRMTIEFQFRATEYTH
jgi:hypothetical protein